MEGVCIPQWNIRGARSKSYLLHEATHNDDIDVVLLQENLDPTSRPVSLRRCQAFSLPKVPAEGNGRFILDKSNIHCSTISTPTYCGQEVGIQGVTLHLAQCTLDVYDIHNSLDTEQLELGQLLAHAASSPTFIGGDFNCTTTSYAPQAAPSQPGDSLRLPSPSLRALASTFPSPLMLSAPMSTGPSIPLTNDNFVIICHLNLPQLPLDGTQNWLIEASSKLPSINTCPVPLP